MEVDEREIGGAGIANGGEGAAAGEGGLGREEASLC